MEDEITSALIRAFTRRASILGYCVGEGKDTTTPCLVVSHGGREICHIQYSGAMCFVCDKALEQEGQVLYDLFRTMKQAYDQYADAEPLNMEGLADFRRLAEFGNCLLAARIGADGEMKYVTWEYDRDRTGVTTGH